MSRAIEALERDLAAIRTGRAGTALVERIGVDYYGTTTPLNQPVVGMAAGVLATLPAALGIGIVPIGDYIPAYEDEMEPLRAFDRALFGGSPEEARDVYVRSSPPASTTCRPTATARPSPRSGRSVFANLRVICVARAALRRPRFKRGAHERDGFFDVIDDNAVPRKLKRPVRAIMSGLRGRHKLKLASLQQRLDAAQAVPGSRLRSTIAQGETAGAARLILDGGFKPFAATLGGEGIQANVEKEFGPTPGFLVAWSFWVSNWVAQAAVAVAAASALSIEFALGFGG